MRRSALPNNRGHVVYLHADFFGRKQLLALLDALAQDFEFPQVESDTTREEIDLARSSKSIQPMRLFDSEVRTGTLVALEALGGTAKMGELQKGVLGEYPGSVGNAVRFFIRVGVLKKRKTIVSFCADAGWNRALRALLKAYVRVSGGREVCERIARLREAL